MKFENENVKLKKLIVKIDDYLKYNDVMSKEEFNEIVDSVLYKEQKERDSIKIEGYTNTWSKIDSQTFNGETYYLMENDVYGDETCYVVLDSKNKVVCDTYDDIETSLKDYGVI